MRSFIIEKMDELLPLRPTTKEAEDFIVELFKDPWLRNKANRVREMNEVHDCLRLYLKELMEGNKKFLDIGCGFGLFLEMSRFYNNEPVGVYYDPKTQVLNYYQYAQLMFERQDLKAHDVDIYDVLLNRNYAIFNDIGIKDIDVINCKKTINLIFMHHFKNKKWIIDSNLSEMFNRFFELCNVILSEKGIILITPLSSENGKEYSKVLVSSAIKNKFEVLHNNGHSRHKFRKA